MTVCNSKVFYDNEWEAQLGVARAEHRFGTTFITYKCGRHWHIAHEKIEERGKQPLKEKRDFCEYCNQEINPIRYQEHIQKDRHKMMMKKALSKEKAQD